jgi:hypothetical protein
MEGHAVSFRSIWDVTERRLSSGAPISVIPSAVVVNRWNVDAMIHFGVVLEANRRRYWKL